MPIGDLIVNLRHQRGWSMEALAQRAGVTRSHIWAIEHGTSDMTISVLQGIAHAFDMGAGDLLTDAGYTVREQGPCPMCGYKK